MTISTETQIELADNEQGKRKLSTKKFSDSSPRSINVQQQRLLHIALKLSILVLISLTSSFMYQILITISVAMNHSSFGLYFFAY